MDFQIKAQKNVSQNNYLGWFIEKLIVKKQIKYIALFFLIGLSCSDQVIIGQSIRKLTVWTHHRHMANITKELIDQYNNSEGREKGIKLSLRVLGDDAWVFFQEAQKCGEGPDLYSSFFQTGYPDTFEAGAQIWFDDFSDFEEWKKQWPDWYWIEGVTTYNGHVYAIPFQVINSRLIYNRSLFRAAGLDPNEPPRSYEELRKTAAKITELGNGRAYGFAYCGAGSWQLEWMPSQWAEANGDAAYWDWKRGRWAMRGYEKVFQLLMDLEKDGSMFPGIFLLTNDALRSQFAEGRIGMFMGEFWDVGVFNEQFPAKCDWGVAPIPTFDGKFHGKSRAMIIGGFWSINAQTKYPMEAWDVVKWFNRYEIRAKMYERGKIIDPDPLVASKYVTISPNARGFKEFAATLDQDYLATYPILPGWEAPQENPFTVLRKVMTEGGDLSVELQRLDELWNKKLDEYYREHTEVKRGWNIYPNFDKRKGQLGEALVKPNQGG
jgi:multiple sugar transport system substrate-binding protein